MHFGIVADAECARQLKKNAVDEHRENKYACEIKNISKGNIFLYVHGTSERRDEFRKLFSGQIFFRKHRI